MEKRKARRSFQNWIWWNLIAASDRLQVRRCLWRSDLCVLTSTVKWNFLLSDNLSPLICAATARFSSLRSIPLYGEDVSVFTSISGVSLHQIPINTVNDWITGISGNTASQKAPTAAVSSACGFRSTQTRFTILKRKCGWGVRGGGGGGL